MDSIGGRVRAARKRAGLTQVQLAHKAGCDPTSVSRIERDGSAPTAHVIAGIARALDVSVDSLLYDQQCDPDVRLARVAS